MIDRETALQNRLLAALKPEDLGLLLPAFTLQECAPGKILQEAGSDVRFAWFPLDAAAASFVVAADANHLVDAALIGCEGAVCGLVSSGRLPAYARAHVQFGGRFLRIPLSALAQAKEQSPSISRWVARYADCLVAQLFQSAACNASHTIAQRLSRWLLATRDRIHQDEIIITQEQLGEMLGVGRSFINRSLRQLGIKGILGARRRRIVIRDVDQLRTIACDCNDRIREHFDHVLAGVYPHEADSVAA
ncbi:Crp/Fnr family transcriptional regulator [Rhizorhabdus dicambivorans]|uniref:Crp/Fnr family transcriptional regulator n=1 Tax=Rhizorhabdus dicambivorans TaxID=1850238 RepID=A0A2A4FR15_9SPHN|nr:helix-turn-helix domain-containing protein [Rhizorhabdus dicambivorans]ATE65429.1 Crp/Fnr family transcriptional regulator [Rhizorhabdus dicambivorans]PCE40607.1 Crp/Fnr family transcriptional regulator [Rhizorhabdus dicambivorans]